MMMLLIMVTPLMKHPMSLGFLLIMQTSLVSMNLFINLESSWYSYILFITIIGGMMVMFMYMASISSNEKFKTMNMKLIIFMLILMTLIFNIKKETMLNELNLKLEEKKLIYQEFQETKSTYKFFNFNKNKITILMMLVLLITMISVTNISSSFEGPLKKT
uniref:NADH dehydrogenase subunit 6 n=1 Tax=Symplana brevistrata TaxID=2231408 RepID=UPI001E7A4FF2|nr:NADH dehydrogenase subunit 6 [Symplana brevistrata]UDL72016.1 NADH dehydrogenase subunit 6 [Symplana brevistrata]